MMQVAIQIGLHQPTHPQDFSRTKVRLQKEDIQDRLRLLEAFKSSQMWNLFRSPHLLLRKDIVEIIRLLESSVTEKKGATEQYKVVVLDQFGHPMRVTPTVDYSVLKGSGTISDTGLFTAGSTAGTVTLAFLTGDLSADVNATVVS